MRDMIKHMGEEESIKEKEGIGIIIDKTEIPDIKLQEIGKEIIHPGIKSKQINT